MAGTSLTDSAFLFRGEGEGEAICSAQTKRVWQMQLLELRCLEAKRLPFAEPKQMAPAPRAKEQFRASDFPEGRIIRKEPFLWATAAGGGMKTLACSHSYAIKNQPDSLSLFVLGGRGGHTLCKLTICCGEWEQFVLRKQNAFGKCNCLSSNALRQSDCNLSSQNKQAAAPYAKEQFAWLKQIAFGHTPSFVNAREMRFVELKQPELLACPEGLIIRRKLSFGQRRREEFNPYMFALLRDQSHAQAPAALCSGGKGGGRTLQAAGWKQFDLHKRFWQMQLFEGKAIAIC